MTGFPQPCDHECEEWECGSWEDGVGNKDGGEGVYLVAINGDISSGRISSAQSPIARTSLPGVAAS